MTIHSQQQRDISRKYCPRFGEIAVEKGFITEEQLASALRIQIEDELEKRARRYLGVILFDKDWMTSEQIEEVLNLLFRRMRDDGGLEDPALVPTRGV